MGAAEINKITVVGPGMMGHAIAQEFASAGYAVMLYGRSDERLQQALQKMERNLKELAEWDIISSDEVRPALDRIETTTALDKAGEGADLVVESIIEDLEVKRQLFTDLDRICPPHTILASNTSSLLPSDLGTATRRPDRVLIAHYFNPPYLMPLVEIVRGKSTDESDGKKSHHLSKRSSWIYCQSPSAGIVARSI
jgi:3-hydroxybutyryl-CoA dehydrogenase